MSKNILIIGIVFLLSFSLVEALDCSFVPDLPNVFYGYARYGGNILANKTVTATLGVHEFTTITDLDGYYYLAVARCSNDVFTSVTFNVCTRDATETATYSSGGVTNLDLTTSSNCPGEDSDSDGVPDDEDLCPHTTDEEPKEPIINGCSCKQILDLKPGENKGELKKGCSEGTIKVFTKLIGWAKDLFE